MCRAQAAWVVYEFEKSSRGGLGRNRLLNPGVAVFSFVIVTIVIIVALVVIVVIVVIATIVALVIIVVKAPWPLRGPWGFLSQNLQFPSNS
jgi:hypothetical protein